MKPRYEGPSNLISSTIIGREPTFRWGRTHRNHERFSRRKSVPLWPCHKSVGYTTVTNDGLPEKPQVHGAARCISWAFRIAPERSLWHAYIVKVRSKDS